MRGNLTPKRSVPTKSVLLVASLGYRYGFRRRKRIVCGCVDVILSS
jgi:hypothetical protein